MLNHYDFRRRVCIFAGTISWEYYGSVIYLISLTFIIRILILGPNEKDRTAPARGPPWWLLSCGSPVHTLHAILYLPLKTSWKRWLAHSKFSLQLAREYSKLFSTFLSSSSKGVHVKRAVRKWPVGRAEPRAGSFQRRDFIMEKMQTVLLITYRQRIIITSPNTWSSSKETAGTVHERYQKDTEENAFLKSIGVCMRRACMPVWLPFGSG